MKHTAGIRSALTLLAFAVSIATAVPAESQQGRRSGSSQLRGEEVDTTFAFAPNGTLEIQMPHIGRGAADVRITGWARNEMRVQGETEDGQLSLALSGQHVDIGTRSDGGMTRVDHLEVHVPYGTRIRVNNGNGDVMITGTRGSVEATSFNGDITIVDAADRLKLKTFNGDIQASNISGRLSVSASNGDIGIRGVRGDVEVSSLNGDIELRDITSTNVHAKTMSGRIAYDGNVERTGEYNFNAFSGAIDMAIPASAGATLTVSTFSGTIDSPDFPLTLKPGTRSRESKGQSMTFDLGGGGARISLESFSGEITIRERRPGVRGN